MQFRWGTVCVAALVTVAGAWASAQGPAGGAPQTPGAGRSGAMVGKPAQDTAKGAALIAEARKALGGEDRFKGVQRLEIKGKSARAQAQANIEGDFEYLVELPDKFRRKESISLGNAGVDITQILNGAEVFEEASFGGGGGGIGGFDGGDGGDGGGRGGGGRGGRGGRMGGIAGLLGGTAAVPGADPEAQREAQRRALASEVARFSAAILLAISEPVAWIGVAESPDGKADVLEFSTPDGVPTRLLLDAGTHLPLMLTWVGAPTAAADFGGRGNRAGRGGNRGDGGGAPPDAAQAQGRRGGGRGGAQVPMQMHLSDYKVVNGMRLPHLIQRGANGETTEEFVVRSYRINPSFRTDTFQK